MDERLSLEERAVLRAGALRALRAMLAEQEARVPPGMAFGVRLLLTTPAERDHYHRLLDDLLRAGERLYTTDYDWSPVIPPSTCGKRPPSALPRCRSWPRSNASWRALTAIRGLSEAT